MRQMMAFDTRAQDADRTAACASAMNICGHFVLSILPTPSLSYAFAFIAVSFHMRQVMAFDTSAQEPPQQMVWCGQDCVLLHWHGLGVLMVGPGGDWAK